MAQASETLIERVVLDERAAPGHEPLPTRRRGYAQTAQLAGHEVTLRTGEYADGRPGEIRIEMPGGGADWQGMLDGLSASVSIGLQYGVPLEAFVKAFAGVRFGPAGPVVGNPAVCEANSVLDYVARDLAIAYQGCSDPGEGATAGQTPVAQAPSGHAPFADARFTHTPVVQAPPGAHSARPGQQGMGRPPGFAPLADPGQTQAAGASHSCPDCGGEVLALDRNCCRCQDCGATLPA